MELREETHQVQTETTKEKKKERNPIPNPLLLGPFLGPFLVASNFLLVLLAVLEQIPQTFWYFSLAEGRLGSQ